MRRMCWLTAVVLSLTLSTRQVQAASTITLNDIRYDTQGGHSRVTLVFDGEIRYSPSLAGGVVRLGLSRTNVAVPLKARRQLPRTGLVAAISVTAMQNDSAVVAIMLHPATTYRCVLPAVGNVLHVDVVPVDGRVAGPALGSSASRLASVAKPIEAKPGPVPVKAPVRENRDTAPKTKQQSSPASDPIRPPANPMVDIPAVAREQLRSEEAARTPRVAEIAMRSPGISPTLAVMLSCLIAVLITGSGAALILSRQNAPAKPAVSPRSTGETAALPVREQAPAEKSVLDLLREVPEGNDDPEFIYDSSVQLARSFRRGSEEITLARRLHDRPTPQLSGARMDETLSRATTPNQRLHFARKLGVGRGEMDLAMKLRTIRPAEKREGVGS